MTPGGKSHKILFLQRQNTGSWRSRSPGPTQRTVFEFLGGFFVGPLL